MPQLHFLDRTDEAREAAAALFGSRVRKLRTAAGLTQEDLGKLAHVVGSRVAQVERATGAKPTLAPARTLGADGLLVDLWPYVYRETFPNWSRAYTAYAEQAVSVRQYAASVVPGLLQTTHGRCSASTTPSPERPSRRSGSPPG